MNKMLFHYKNNKCQTRTIKRSKNHPNSYRPEFTTKTTLMPRAAILSLLLCVPTVTAHVHEPE